MTPRTMLCTALVLAGCAHGRCPAPASPVNTGSDVPLSEPISAPRALTVTSTDFADGQTIPMSHVFNAFGCTGGNASPQLAWTGAPAGTRSFAVVAHDPDAPTGVGFFHWIVADLPASTTTLAGGAPLAQGAVAGRTDFGGTTYGGPCPPPGAPHHSHFTVYALDVPSLGLADPPSGALIRFMLRAHTLAYGRITGTYGR